MELTNPRQGSSLMKDEASRLQPIAAREQEPGPGDAKRDQAESKSSTSIDFSRRNTTVGTEARSGAPRMMVSSRSLAEELGAPAWRGRQWTGRVWRRLASDLGAGARSVRVRRRLCRLLLSRPTAS